MASEAFPFGDPNPPGGFKVGDEVGLIYSDHEHYVFDNPAGVVVAVKDWTEDEQWIEVEVRAGINSARVYLIDRKEAVA